MMKFNVSGKTLLHELNAVSKVINSKNTIAIYDNFLFKIEGNQLTIVGSDQENIVSATLEITESESDGKIALPAKRLIEMVKEISGQPLSFEIDEELHVDIKFLNGHFEFMGTNPDEYPDGTLLDEDSVEFELPSEVILNGLETTLFAVSPDPIRPAMTGVYWDIHDDDIVFVSSDTHKLVRYINSQFKPGRTTSFIIHAKPCSILRSLLAGEEGDVKVAIDTKRALFTFGNYTLGCRFIKGVYPNYNRVIPTDSPYEVDVDRESLLNATRRVSLLASEGSNLVVVNLSENEIHLSGKDVDFSTSADEVISCNYNGRPMKIGYNSVYMIEVLSNLRAETVAIQLSDPGRPGLFLPLEQKEGENTVMLQMPLQVIE